jgi:MFS family permease
MTATSTATHPALRHRLPLYPSQFIGAMALVSLGPLLDPMMRDLGVPLSKGGLISAGLFLGNVFGITILNMTMSRVPAKWALAGGTALLGAGLLVAGAASRNLWSLSLAFVLVGLAGAFMNATCWMWLAAHIRKDVAASALAMILFFGLGMVVTPVVLGQVIDRGATWRWILVAEGGIALAMALVLACLPLLDILGRQNVRFSHLRQVVAHDPWLLLGILGAGLMYTGTETTINVWLPKFQIDVFGASDTWASLAVSLFWVGLVVGRFTVMRPADPAFLSVAALAALRMHFGRLRGRGRVHAITDGGAGAVRRSRSGSVGFLRDHRELFRTFPRVAVRRRLLAVHPLGRDR